MYKQILVVLVGTLVTMVTAKPVSRDDDNGLVSSNSTMFDTLGNYYFKYVTSDGTLRQERGSTRLSETGDRVAVVTGTVQWLSPEGVQQGYHYEADEDGYKTRPQTNQPFGMTGGHGQSTFGTDSGSNIGSNGFGGGFGGGFGAGGSFGAGCSKGFAYVDGECAQTYSGKDLDKDEGENISSNRGK